MHKLAGAISTITILLVAAFTLAACQGGSQAPLPTLAGRGAGHVSVATPQVAMREFVHPTWGISFSYPADWSLEIPDFDAIAKAPALSPNGETILPNVEDMRLLGHHVTLYPPDNGQWPKTEIVIHLDSYTISSNTDLKKWVTLRDDVNAVENPIADLTTTKQVDVSDRPYAHVADQVVYSILENPYIHVETVWLAKADLVYALDAYGADLRVLDVLEQVAASIKFDDKMMAELRAKATFAGNEDAMSAYIESHKPPATPAIPPTPESNSGITPVETSAYHPSMTNAPWTAQVCYVNSKPF